MLQAELNAPQAVITCEKEKIKDASTASRLPQCIPMNTDQFAIVSSIFTLGGFVGALVAGPACSKYGRLLTMRVMTLFFLIGPGLEASAASIGALCAGRLLSGLGCGAAVVVVPIYISEISPLGYKGLFGATTQIMINFGILIAQLLGYFFSRGSLWRAILAVAGGFGIIQLAGLLIVPESPKWLAEHNQARRARHVLEKLRGRGVDLGEETASWKANGTSGDAGKYRVLISSKKTANTLQRQNLS